MKIILVVLFLCASVMAQTEFPSFPKFYNFIPIGSYSADDGADARWAMDDAAFYTVADDSISQIDDRINAYNITQSTTANRPAFATNAVDFDGTNDDIFISHAGGGSNLKYAESVSFTIEWYADCDGASTVHTIFSMGRRAVNGIVVYVNASLNRLYFYSGGTSVYWESETPESKHYGAVTITSNGSEWQTAELFLNGVSQGAEDISGTTVNYTTYGVGLGANRLGSSDQDFFDGKIYEVRISPSIRTQSEIDAYKLYLESKY